VNSNSWIKYIENPRKRELTEFMAREMVFDFWLDKLDEIRMGQFKEAVTKYINLEHELEILQSGHSELAAIRGIPVSGFELQRKKSLGSRINENLVIFKRSSRRFKTAIVSITLVAILIVYFSTPWSHLLQMIGLKPNQITIIEVDKSTEAEK
jgi:hypothetical protein